VGEPGFFTNIKLKVSRMVAPINPFAHPGVETPDRISYPPKMGNGYFHPSPLPNPVQNDNFLNGHMDPEIEENTFNNSYFSSSRFDLAYSTLEKRHENLP
jgi:hypothetical protein